MSAEKDMLLMTVGRKTGRDANETLIDKKISAWSQGTRLERVLTVAEDLKRDQKPALSADDFSSRVD